MFQRNIQLYVICMLVMATAVAQGAGFSDEHISVRQEIFLETSKKASLLGEKEVEDPFTYDSETVLVSSIFNEQVEISKRKSAVTPDIKMNLQAVAEVNIPQSEEIVEARPVKVKEEPLVPFSDESQISLEQYLGASDPNDAEGITLIESETGFLMVQKPVQGLTEGDQIKLNVLDQLKNSLIIGKDLQAISSVPAVATIDNQQMVRLHSAGEFELIVTDLKNVSRFRYEVSSKRQTDPLPNIAQSAPSLSVPKEITSIGLSRGVASSAVSAKINAKNYKQTRNAAEGHQVYESTTESEIEYTDLTVQVVEDRSHFSDGLNKVYPAVNVRLEVVGSQEAFRTDSRGEVVLTGVPVDSRLIIKIDDKNRYYRPTLLEVSSNREKTIIHLLRSSIFETYADISGNVPRGDLGSICGEISQVDQRSEVTNVEIDAEASGPYYFNEHGFLDPSSEEMSSIKRFCFFNVETGPAVLNFFVGEENMFSSTAVIAASSHQQKLFELKTFEPISWNIRSLATAREHFSSDTELSTQLRFVDVIDVYPFGSDSPLEGTGVGKVGYFETTERLQRSLFVAPESGEFERTVSRLSGDEKEVVLLLPNGFVEDLSYHFNRSYDHGLGSVVVVYQRHQLDDDSPVNITLKRLDGREVSEPLYITGAPLTKAAFLNIPFGSYLVSVEDQSGRWLLDDVVHVYEQRTSIVLGGKPLN